MKRVLLLLLFVLAGCGGGVPAKTVTDQDLEALKSAMTSVFSALEMYAHDHSLEYPESVAELVPKYLDEVPLDPANGQSLVYEKTERGYLIKAAGSYHSVQAADGFPCMNQDGFFALKPSDFPSEMLED